MQLEEFVQSTIQLIVQGAANASDVVAKLGGRVNPYDHNMISPTPPRLTNVEFDVALVVSESQQTEAGGKLSMINVEKLKARTATNRPAKLSSRYQWSYRKADYFVISNSYADNPIYRRLFSNEEFMNIVELKKHVSDFRGALDRLDWFSMPGDFRKFPLGTCGAISDILAEYLYKQGIQEIEYVSGKHRQNSHAWLEIAGYIIDITADQFPDCNEPVIVTDDHTWHHRFKESMRRPAGFFNGFKSTSRPTLNAVRDLNIVYKAALACL